jgi:hypothetical protein
MVSVLKDTEEKYGIHITFSVETEPLDTGSFGCDSLGRQLIGILLIFPSVFQLALWPLPKISSVKMTRPFSCSTRT